MQQNLYLHSSLWRLFLMAAVISGILTLVLVLTIAGVDGHSFWDAMELGLAGKHPEFCEQNRMEQLIRQPANTWSNLSYLYFGVLCMLFALHDIRHPRNSKQDNFLLRFPVLTFLTGVSLFYLFIGSFYYHASLTRTAQIIDLSGVYAVALLPLIYNIARWIYYSNSDKINHPRLYAWAIVCFTILLNALVYHYEIALKSRESLLLVLILVLITTILYHRFMGTRFSFWLFLSPYMFMISAFVIWILDQQKIICAPSSLLQGHAAWHFLTGMSAMAFYFFYRTESIPFNNR
jgi:hypothetical protein